MSIMEQLILKGFKGMVSHYRPLYMGLRNQLFSLPSAFSQPQCSEANIKLFHRYGVKACGGNFSLAAAER